MSVVCVWEQCDAISGGLRQLTQNGTLILGRKLALFRRNNNSDQSVLLTL